MKNFRITEGDLALGANGRIDMVKGSEKLAQDLILWTLEPLGIGFTTPSFGSILDTYNANGDHRFIGQVISEQKVAEVQAEVDRLLNLYQQNQMENIKVAQLRGELALYQKSEILNEIINLEASIPDEERTAIVVKALIRTAVGGNIRLQIETTEEGINVNRILQDLGLQ